MPESDSPIARWFTVDTLAASGNALGVVAAGTWNSIGLVAISLLHAMGLVAFAPGNALGFGGINAVGIVAIGGFSAAGPSSSSLDPPKRTEQLVSRVRTTL